LPSIKDGSVDCIVTDPPWGEHEQVDDILINGHPATVLAGGR
jgi:tRNA G10  N-methylase Trm11